MSDWIKWSGGECPVAPLQKVTIRLSNEMRDDGIYPLDDTIYTANELRWDDRIIAYKVIENDKR